MYRPCHAVTHRRQAAVGPPVRRCPLRFRFRRASRHSGSPRSTHARTTAATDVSAASAAATNATSTDGSKLMDRDGASPHFCGFIASTFFSRSGMIVNVICRFLPLSTPRRTAFGLNCD